MQLPYLSISTSVIESLNRSLGQYKSRVEPLLAAEAKRAADVNPALLTKEIYRPEVKKERVARDDPKLLAELKRLDEQIVDLRRKHERRRGRQAGRVFRVAGAAAGGRSEAFGLGTEVPVHSL